MEADGTGGGAIGKAGDHSPAWSLGCGLTLGLYFSLPLSTYLIN